MGGGRGGLTGRGVVGCYFVLGAFRVLRVGQWRLVRRVMTL